MRTEPGWLLTVWLVLGGLGGGSAAPASAEAAEPICAEVLPCDDQGEVLPQFADADSACLDRYRAQCAVYREDQLIEQALRERIEVLEAENLVLRKRLKALRRALQRADC